MRMMTSERERRNAVERVWEKKKGASYEFVG
jgi:hypothetical protein